METKIVIVDCEKAGLIGGPLAVYVVREGKFVASTSGIAMLARAEKVKARYEECYLPKVAA